LVKRVVGIPGDTVSLVGNQLIVNGQAAQYQQFDQNHFEQYQDFNESLLGQTRTVRMTAKGSYFPDFEQISVPQGFYLALGDNRDQSADSRAIGLVPRDEIIGRTQKVAYSLNYNNYLIPRKERFLKTL